MMGFEPIPGLYSGTDFKSVTSRLCCRALPVTNVRRLVAWGENSTVYSTVAQNFAAKLRNAA